MAKQYPLFIAAPYQGVLLNFLACQVKTNNAHCKNCMKNHLTKAGKKISVVATAYNSPELIRRQLYSILGQLSEGDEVIIVDDSNDVTAAGQIAHISTQDSRIIYYKTATQLGVIKANEVGLSLVSGEIIVLADHDDEFIPGRLTFLRNFYTKNEQVTLIVEDCIQFDIVKMETLESVFRMLKSGPGVLKNLIKNTFLGASMSFRAELLPYVLPFPNNIPMHDIWIGLVANIFREVRFVESKAIIFYRHNTNTTPLRTVFHQKLLWRLILIIELVKRIVKIYALRASTSVFKLKGKMGQ